MSTTRIILTKDNATAENFSAYLAQFGRDIHEICERHCKVFKDEMDANSREFKEYMLNWKVKMDSRDKLRLKIM